MLCDGIFNSCAFAVASSTSSIERLAGVILRYVSAHPEACDSLEGICDWWLMRQRHDDALRDVAAAVEILLERGHIEAWSGAGGRQVYRAKVVQAAEPSLHGRLH